MIIFRYAVALPVSSTWLLCAELPIIGVEGMLVLGNRNQSQSIANSRRSRPAMNRLV
jgi:hypothetical protein